MPAVTTAGAGKTVGEDVALQILLERFAHEGLGAVVVALAIELAWAGEFIPGFAVLSGAIVRARKAQSPGQFPARGFCFVQR